MRESNKNVFRRNCNKSTKNILLTRKMCYNIFILRQNICELYPKITTIYKYLQLSTKTNR